MDLLVLAQLVTGIATLVVASVLIWQMIIQKRTLDIAHNDADSNVSLMAMDTRSRTNEWFAENCTPEMADKLDKGLDTFTEKEKLVINTYWRSTMRVLSTEWRLGRLIDQKWYYKNTFLNEGMLHLKAFRDVYNHHMISMTRGIDGSNNDLYSGMRDLGREAYEETEPQKTK